MVVEPDVLERLYAVEPEEFVAERKRVERSLRDEGRTQEAEEVATLRKPPLPVFLANRLAREEADLVTQLVEDGERLAAAHEAGDPEQLRTVQGDLAARVNALVRHAGDLSDAIEQRLATLLRAAASNPAPAALLRRGVLSEEVEPAAFDALAGIAFAPRARQPARRKPSAGTERKRARVDELEGQLSEAKGALRQAERDLREAERALERATSRAERLQRQVEEARRAV